MAYIKQACNSIAQKVADDKAPPRKEPDDGDGGWLRPREVGLFKSEASKGTEAAHFQSKLVLIEELALIEVLAPPSKPKRKPSRYKSKPCQHGRRKAQCKDCSPKSFCQHGRRKAQCKDGGTGHCQHGRR
jgi:hypothetical protein